MEKRENSPKWRLNFRLRTLFAAVTGAAILLVVIYPKLITGDFVKIKNVETGLSERGFVQYRFHVRNSAGTTIAIARRGNLKTSIEKLESGWPRLPTWPNEYIYIVDLVGETEQGQPELVEGQLLRAKDEVIIDTRVNRDGDRITTTLKVRGEKR